MKRYIKFNDITFGGGNFLKINENNSYTPFIISEFDPNSGEAEYRQTNLIGDGAIFSDFRYQPRMISLKGYILPKKGEKLEDLRVLLASKINGKKTAKLTFFDGQNKYFCNAFADIPVFAQPVKNSVLFNINFTVPDFFWYEESVTSVAVCERKNNITGTFSLPLVFTTRTASGTVYNHNDFSIYPTIKIIANAMSAAVSLEIENETTGEKIILSNYAISAGEEIIIDLKNVTAQVGNVSAINYFNDFSEFAVIPGSNLIKVTDTNTDSKLTVSVEYNAQYVCI